MRFEFFKKTNKTGRRRFKLVIHEIYDDESKTNQNGINWLEEYTRKNIQSVIGMSLRACFQDESRTEVSDHGFINEIVEGVPLFSDATVVGHFDKAYIGEIEDEDGEKIKACIGEGEIDGQAYPDFCKKLDEDLDNGIFPAASVEIMHSPDNEEIVYLHGYNPECRTPTEYIYSGMALLQNCEPADPQSRLLELNSNKEENKNMNETEIKAIVSKTVAEIRATSDEIAKVNEKCEASIAEAKKEAEDAVAEKNEAVITSDKIQKALDEVKNERDELNKKYDELWAEHRKLEDLLSEYKVKERLAALDSATEQFSDVEKDYAKDEIESFKADPANCEINSVVSKIWEGIGKSAKATEKVVAEQNSAKVQGFEDIFGEMTTSSADVEEINIF